MHREMLASTVQFSRDNQALKPHQHPPDTTTETQQRDLQETTHPTTTRHHTPPVTGMDTRAKPRQDTRPTTTTQPHHHTHVRRRAGSSSCTQSLRTQQCAQRPPRSKKMISPPRTETPEGTPTRSRTHTQPRPRPTPC